MTGFSGKEKIVPGWQASEPAHRIAAAVLLWCIILTAASIGSVVWVGGHDPMLEADIRRTVLAILVPSSLMVLIGVPLAWIVVYCSSQARVPPSASEHWESTHITKPQSWLDGGRDLAEQSSFGRSPAKDALTGLLSHSAFMTFAEDAIPCFLRYRHKVAILFVELDRFRSVSQAYGAEGADQVLRHVADVLDLSLRRSDKACRADASRFMVLLREIDEADTVALATRICKAMEDLGVRHLNQILPVTVSIGAAIVADDDVEITSLIDRAESALANAKLAGGNCVQVQPATSVPPLHKAA